MRTLALLLALLVPSVAIAQTAPPDRRTAAQNAKVAQLKKARRARTLRDQKLVENWKAELRDQQVMQTLDVLSRTPSGFRGPLRPTR